jgi:hypothetical protein
VFSYHPKLFQLPIGQDLHCFCYSPSMLEDLLIAHEKKSSFTKQHLLYMNFFPRDHGNRDSIAKLFKNKSYCHSIQQNIPQSRAVFYGQLASSKFALSPFGLETDSVRTWEALVYDCIPIVEHTFLDPIYEGLPVLIVHDWTEIDQPLLEQKYEELKDLKRDKAYFPYWEEEIEKTQRKVRNRDLGFTELQATLFSEQDIDDINTLLGERTALIYKGFLSTLRPLQVSQYGRIQIKLHDPWLDQRVFADLCSQSNIPNLVAFLSSELEFNKKIAVEEPTAVFLDLNYYRTSLRISFDTSTCHMGNFRHSLKVDLEDLYESLYPGSLLFGTMGDEPYVKKVLDLFADDYGREIERKGSFWSIKKEKKTAPLNELFPDPYSSILKPLPFQPSKWYSYGHIFKRLIQEHNMKTLVLIGSSLTATPLQLGELIPCDGRVFAVDPSPEEKDHQQFLSNVIHAELTNHIIPVRMDPLQAAKKIRSSGLPVDLIYFETPQEYFPTYQTLQAWFLFVKKRGIICGNGWNNPEAQRAIIQFSLENGQIIQNENDFWMFL